MIFSILFVIYVSQINLKKVEMQIKVIICLLMVFIIANLFSSSFKYAMAIKLIDSLLSNNEKFLASIEFFTLLLMTVVQFFFVQEMGEVYIKITSDNPQESQKKLRVLKRTYIFLYTVASLALISRLLMLFLDTEK